MGALQADAVALPAFAGPSPAPSAALPASAVAAFARLLSLIVVTAAEGQGKAYDATLPGYAHRASSPAATLCRPGCLSDTFLTHKQPTASRSGGGIVSPHKEMP